MKKLLTLTTTAAILCFTMTTSFAEDHLSRLHVYQNGCTKSCHTNSSNGGEIDISSKTQYEWKELLKNEQMKLQAKHDKKINLDNIAKKHPSLDDTPWNIVESHLETLAFNGDQPDEILYR